jgi:ribosomal protein S18 acetylase RimI-like enzyme
MPPQKLTPVCAFATLTAPKTRSVLMVDIVPAKTLEDFRALRLMLDEMAAWDAAETRANGQDPTALLAEGYNDSPAQLQSLFTSRGAAMFLAFHDGSLAGCAGFSRVNADMSEVEKVYVRPEARGLGVGIALLTTVMAGMASNGSTAARLETATFMTTAQALYRRFGFAQVPAFRASLGDLGATSVFMACDFAAAAQPH